MNEDDLKELKGLVESDSFDAIMQRNKFWKIHNEIKMLTTSGYSEAHIMKILKEYLSDK